MTKGKRTVRASEIGSFIYCQRAWWYQRQGFEPMNRTELAAGSEFHSAHAGKARSVILMRVIAWVLVFAALAYLTVIFGARLFN
jgi:CRISPR/Cas system-associated exonuclease Cas4 (RecB family)